MDRAEHIRALQAEYAQLQAQDRREAEARLREVLAEGGVEPAGFHHLTV